MTQARRRNVLRPARAVLATDARRQAALPRKRSELAKEQQALARWMTRLRRAFHAVEKQQQRVRRLERQIAEIEQA